MYVGYTHATWTRVMNLSLMLTIISFVENIVCMLKNLVRLAIIISTCGVQKSLVTYWEQVKHACLPVMIDRSTTSWKKQS